MSSVNKRFFILVFVLTFGMSTVFAGTFQNNLINAAIGNFAGASLTTEKTDYLKGENVVFSGAGFGRNESVLISIENYNDSLRENITLMQWNVYASARGVFSATIPFDSLKSENGKYILRATGSRTGATAETIIIDSAVLAIGVDIEQCANGPLSAPINCNVNTGNDGYTRGNLVASKSHYKEGDFVPIRIVATGLTVGQTYTVTIGYDYTKGGKYANDYLGDYDYTESVNNDPCVGVAGCDLSDVETFGVPLDPQVALGFDGVVSGDDITQIPGSFSIFGGTITAVSGYTLSGSTSGDSTKSLTITFEADESTVVIAYGSHISTRTDWGSANSAINISGSPYHNYVVDFPGANQGNRDLQLEAAAVIFPATIRIIKDAQPNSCFDFGFSATGQINTTFSLDDDAGFGCADENTLSTTREFTDLVLFGSGNTVTVTETNPAPYDLTQINCQSFANGGTSVNNNSTNIPLRSATIQLEEGELVVCTFVNSVTTAAEVRVGGRVMDGFGTPISRATIRIENLSSGEVQSTTSNSFGFYSFESLPSGDAYLVTVSHRRYTFSNGTQLFTLNDAIENLDFVAN